MKKIQFINTRKGWYEFYANRFNKTGSKQAEWMAMWYLFLMLQDGEIPSSDLKKSVMKLVPKPLILSDSNTSIHNLLLILEAIHADPKLRRNTHGICHAVEKILYERVYNTQELMYKNKAYIEDQLTVVFNSWKHLESFPFVIPGGDKAYATAMTNRKVWTRSTKYGALRWDLLEHCIAECRKMYKAEQTKLKPKLKKAA